MKHLGKLLNLAGYPYQFVGDGQVVIAGKFPDFLRSDREKKIIELFGEKWHKKAEEEERINHFARHGYSALIVWSKELKHPDAVIAKVKIFEEG